MHAMWARHLVASMLSTKMQVSCILQQTLGMGKVPQKQGPHQLRPYSRAQPARRMGQDDRVMPQDPTLTALLCPTIDRFGWQSTFLTTRPDLNLAMLYLSGFGVL